MSLINDRFKWAKQVMKVRPHDKVLEVGCGVGLAVECIAPTLTKGKMVAIDRSSSMINKAAKRNQQLVKEGKAEFYHTDLLRFSSGETFTVIFCFNINFFWTQKTIEREAEVIKRHLSPKGRLYILYGPLLAGGLRKTKNKVIENLGCEHLGVVEFVEENDIRCCCFKVTKD